MVEKKAWIRKPYNYIWPLIILLSADVMVITDMINAPALLRIPVAFWFLLVCPGMAFIRLFNLDEGIVEWILAIALSIGIDTIVSEIALLNHLWSPIWIIFALAFIAILGAITQIAFAIRQKRSRIG